MSDEPKIEVHTFPALDTGIGREAGYRDDAEMIKIAAVERSKQPPEVQELLDRIDREVIQRFVSGD